MTIVSIFAQLYVHEYQVSDVKFCDKNHLVGCSYLFPSDPHYEAYVFLLRLLLTHMYTLQCISLTIGTSKCVWDA